jgi:hypothetical protein
VCVLTGKVVDESDETDDGTGESGNQQATAVEPMEGQPEQTKQRGSTDTEQVKVRSEPEGADRPISYADGETTGHAVKNMIEQWENNPNLLDAVFY